MSSRNDSTSELEETLPVSALIELLKQEDPVLRIKGSSALRRMGTRSGANALGADVYGWSGFSPVGGGDVQDQEVKAAVPHLVTLLNDQDTDVRVSAADTLRWIGSKAVPALANPTLVKLLEDENATVREAAVITLNFLLPDAATIATAPLVKCLEDENGKVRGYALMLLEDISRYEPIFTDIKAQATVDALIRLLENKDDLVIQSPDEDFYFRGRVSKILGNAKAQVAIEPLLKLLENKDEDVYLRTSVVEALRNMQAQAAIQPLLKLLENKDEGADLRTAAAEALKNIEAQAVIEPLVKHLQDKDENTGFRSSAAEVLGSLQAQVAIEPLLKLLENKDEDAYLRANAAEALGSLQAQVAIEPLLKLLENKDEDAYLRASAAEALGSLQAQISDDLLIKFLKDAQEDFHQFAIETLRNIIRVQTNNGFLVKMLEDKNIHTSIRAAAAEALGTVKAQDAVNPLFKCMTDNDEHWEARLNAFAALANMGSVAEATIEPIAKSFIVEALNTNLELGRYGDDFYGINVNMPPYKRHAFFFVTIDSGKFPSFKEDVREILINKNYDYKVRYSAAFILGYIGLQVSSNGMPLNEIVAALNSIVNDSDEDIDIRWMSAFSLKKLGQDTNHFFAKNNLVNPIQITCDTYDVLDPFIGYCESKTGAGGSVEKWVETFKDMLEGKK